MINFIDAKVALTELVSGDYSLNDLKNLVAQVDVGNAEGNITVLYSGTVDNISAGNIANRMALEDPNIRIINKTHAAEFLVSNQFKSAVADKFGVLFDDIDGLPATHPPTH